jgi:hypothetical protein
MKSGAVVTRDQPVPIGLALLFHQIRQNPDSNLTTEKSAATCRRVRLTLL